MQFTKEFIQNACEQTNYEQFPLVMDNGDIINIVPCTYAPTPAMDNIEYWLVYGPLPWMGASSLDELLNQLNGYADLLQQASDEKARLKKFFDDHIDGKTADDDTQSFYSDWHKDVFGFRPKYNCFGVHR